MKPEDICIGLFGPDERNPWRKPLVEAFEAREIPYADPTRYETGSGFMSTYQTIDAHNAKMSELFRTVKIMVLGSINPLLLPELESDILAATAVNPDREFIILLPRSPFPHGVESIGDLDARKRAHKVREQIIAYVKRLNSPNVHLFGEVWSVQRPPATQPPEAYREREQREVMRMIDQVRNKAIELYFKLEHEARQPNQDE